MADSYIRSPYRNDSRSMLDLMRLASADRSRSDRERASVRAQGVMNIGQLIAGALASIRQEGEQRAQQSAMLQKQQQDDAFKRRDQEIREADLMARVQEQGMMRDERSESARVAQQAAQYKQGTERAESIGYGPMSEMDVDPVMAGNRAGDVRYSFGPGTAEGPELLPTRPQQEAITMRQKLEGMGYSFGPNGQVIPPQKPEAPPRPVSVPDGGRLVDPQTGQVVYSAPPRQSSDNEPLMAVMGDDGQPVYMPRSQAAGRRPASTREQGRPVTSGDAGRIADLDTSLDDLAVLDQTVTGSTGTSAKVGAMLPNWVTEVTGRGISAKQKQASIDRVKQVIGKALEGGVLRKEDEKKYEKILPTIYDPPEVVQTKLSGLRSALEQRRQTTLEALSDAGYDTSKFTARKKAPGKTDADDKIDALIKKYGGGS